MSSVRRLAALGLAVGLPLVLGSCQQDSIVEPTPSFNENEGVGHPPIAFHNGSVITMEPVTRVDEAILVRGSRIVATGTSERVLQMAATDAVAVDLEGRTIMPGFVDPHNHTYNQIFLGWSADKVGTTYGEAQQALLEVGTTTIGNPGVWPDALASFLEYVDAEGLRVRSSLYLGYNSSCGDLWPEGWYLSYPPTTDPQAMLRFPGIKIFTDGGSCNTGAFSWRTDPEQYLYMTAEELADVVMEVQALGYQAAIHALGDVAVGMTLDALETVIGDSPNAYRHRIEHNKIIRQEQLPRYGQVGALPVVFGYPYVCGIVDGTLPGWARLENDPSAAYVRPWFFPWRALLDANPGLPVVWKSDGPRFYWPNDPIKHLFSMVTRDEVRDDGSVCEAPAWLAENAVTVEQALSMMTINGAYALKMDQAVGSLRAGKLADLIVLSDNPLEVEPATLKDLEVLMTMVGGQVEHCAEGQEALCPARELELAP